MSGHNPWIPISDLLSGFAVISLLLFATAALVPRLEAEVRAEEQRRKAKTQAELRQERIDEALGALAAQVEQVGLEAVSFDRARRTIEFRDASFDQGSACLTPEAEASADAVARLMVDMLRIDAGLMVFVEGHTDPTPVRRLMRRCGYFSDNLQLSLERGRNVRTRLLGDAHAEFVSRVPVTGFGPERLANSEEPNAAENRRVEVRLVWATD